MLDISIPALTEADFQKLQFEHCTVYEKYDGTKLSIIRNDQPYDPDDYTKNWIVAYKGNIIYPTEFEGVDSVVCARDSIGTSQYKFVHALLNQNHWRLRDIGCNQEFFFEFTMNKPTLTRDYKYPHKLILIAWSPITYEVSFGQIKTNPNQFLCDNRELVADDFGVWTPQVTYRGRLAGISGDFETTRKYLLSYPSSLGGLMEGVVIDIEGKLYKLLQDDQHDAKTRANKKNRYRMGVEDESAYWGTIRGVANAIFDRYCDLDLQDSLFHVSGQIYRLNKLPIVHTKKTLLQIQDDLFLTAKMMLTRALPGNNGALVVGRFSPPTRAHVEMVRDAILKYDKVVLNIVDSGKTDDQNPFPIELRVEMWKKIFPTLDIQTSKTGNLITIINKAERNINAVVCGTDRVETYKKQLARSPDVVVDEVERLEDDISATKVRQALKDDDKNIFWSMMYPSHYDFYDDLKQYI